MDLLEKLLNAGLNTDKTNKTDAPHKPRAKRLRDKNRKAMQGAARQYGRVYYVPAGTKRRWAFIGVGLVLACSSLMFGFYVWVVHALGLI